MHVSPSHTDECFLGHTNNTVSNSIGVLSSRDSAPVKWKRVRVTAGSFPSWDRAKGHKEPSQIAMCGGKKKERKKKRNKLNKPLTRSRCAESSKLSSASVPQTMCCPPRVRQRATGHAPDEQLTNPIGRAAPSPWRIPRVNNCPPIRGPRRRRRA